MVLKTLTKTQAYEIWSKHYNEQQFNIDTIGFKLDENCIQLRNDFIDIYEKSKDLYNEYFSDNQYNERRDYLLDICFGVLIFNYVEEGSTLSRINILNDVFIYYLQLYIIPEIIYERWGLNEDRFFKRNNRLYLKTLYSYIHHTYQGSTEETLKLLSSRSFNTDAIVQIVERRNDYRIIRLLVKKIATSESLKNYKISEIIRKIMMLENAKRRVVVPMFYKGGYESYIDDILAYFK